MNITVKAFATLRTIMPREIRVDIAGGSTVADLIALLGVRYPALVAELYSDPFVLRPYVNILKNGRNIHHLQGVKTPLDAGDTIAFFPPVAGG